jgi:hypothetical protein
VVANEATSLATYASPRAPDRLKQWAGMASRICFIVKSGTSKVFPYVSTSLPLEVRDSLSEPREDNELEEGDCVGLSMGETVAELAEEEADEARVIVRWIAATRGGTAEDDIVEVLLVLSSRTSEIWALRFVVEDGILVGNPYR